MGADILDVSQPKQNVRILQIIRSRKDAAEKEFIKEFFRFIGCLVYDQPVLEVSEWEEKLHTSAADDGNDVDIVLNSPVEGKNDFSAGHRCIYLNFSFEGTDSGYTYQVSSVWGVWETAQTVLTKKELCNGVLTALIPEIWGASSDESDALCRIACLYVERNIYQAMQTMRGFRILRMGEAIDANLDANMVEAHPYILRILCDLWCVYAILHREQKLDQIDDQTPFRRCRYSVYACVNAARVLREIYRATRIGANEQITLNTLAQQIAKSMDAQGWENSPVGCQFGVCAIEPLMRYLRLILDQDAENLTAYVIAASLCKTDEEAKFSAQDYYEHILDYARGGKKYYSFVQYQLGNYYEKIGKNREAAQQCFQQALARDGMCYQARYKVACADARAGRYTQAQQGFERVIDTIFMGLDPSADQNGNYPAWENIHLKGLQYVFKSYIWLAKIAYNYQDSHTFTVGYIGRASVAATFYEKNLLIERSMDRTAITDEYGSDMTNYYKTGTPIYILWEILRTWTNEVVQDAYLHDIIKRKFEDFQEPV